MKNSNKSNEMVYAIYTPSNDPMTLPRYQYSYLGKLSNSELDKLNHELRGSLCTIDEFDSMDKKRKISMMLMIHHKNSLKVSTTNFTVYNPRWDSDDFYGLGYHNISEKDARLIISCKPGYHTIVIIRDGVRRWYDRQDMIHNDDMVKLMKNADYVYIKMKKAIIKL